jgi:competence protein ComEA
VVYRFAAGGGRAGEPAAPSEPLINLNTATAEELDTLPGIGPALAGRIIAYREAYGAFRNVEEILEVRGVGPRVLEGFVDRVTVE